MKEWIYSKNIHLKNDATPVFLLDNTRTNRYRAKESIFDNSWDLYKQDIPTAEYFKQNNISKIIIVADTIQKDLKKIFLEFQKNFFRQHQIQIVLFCF